MNYEYLNNEDAGDLSQTNSADAAAIFGKDVICPRCEADHDLAAWAAHGETDICCRTCDTVFDISENIADKEDW